MRAGGAWEYRRGVARQPFSIVGTGRSGTTYLYSILSDHPRIALTNEAKLFDLLSESSAFARIPAFELDARTGVRGMLNAAYIADFSALLDETIPGVLEAFYERHFAHKEFTHWGDKMVSLVSPSALQRLLPDIRCLVPIRDPRDVVCSWRAAIAYQPFFGQYTLRSFAEMWVRTYAEIGASLRRRFVVRYEDLVRSTERVVRDALGFLGLEWDAACARAIGRHATFASVATSPTPEASLERWRRELDAEDLRTVQEICAAPMAEFDYPPA
jgi:hypothetical protein